MIKKILPISVFVLVLIFIILLGLQNLLNTSKNSQTSTLVPTLVQAKKGAYPSSSTGNATSNPSVSQTQLSEDQLRKQLPIYAPDFTLEYSDRLEKYVLVTPDDTGKNSYDTWLAQNPSYAQYLTQQQVIVSKQTVKELGSALDVAEKNKLTPENQAVQETDTFTSILSTITNFSQLLFPSGNSVTNSQPIIQSPTSSPLPTPTPKKTSLITPGPSHSYTYYSQCGGSYDVSPLPLGCTMCQAGCGPTSIAMILSSYIDSSLTPPKVVDLMSKNGVNMGCGGSSIYELYSYLQGRGDMKVSDFIIPSEKLLSAKDISTDFKGYIKSGWTIFVLANFKTDGGGHYFWVTDVNDSGDILSYDPYYGRGQKPPISENNYAPAPYYRYAFAVKKT